MGQIIRFFKTLIDLLVGVVQFVVKLMGDLVMVVNLLGETVNSLPMAFAWLPGTVVTLLIALFAVVVIYKFLGREG